MRTGVSWVESLDDNTALIRQNIRGSRLRVEPILLGRNTRTRLHVFYLEDVANPHLVSAVRERINAIDIDGIVESSYVEQLISDNPNSLFSLTQASERVDKTVAGILEGRVTIMVDGSSQVILVPTTINELYQSPEDFYFGAYYGSFLRAFRILGNNIAVALPGLYVALVAVNPQLLPARFALTIAGGLRGVAFPLIIELLIMEIIIEVFREASLRLPQPVSQTLGVTAGVVLGITSVAAGLVSNITLVVVLITAIASFSGPNYAIGMSRRLLRYFLILAAAMGGLYGLTLAGLLILAHAAIQESFGVPYLSPWAPLRFPDLGDTVTILPPWKKGRPRTYEPQDTVRSRKEGKKDE